MEKGCLQICNGMFSSSRESPWISKSGTGCIHSESSHGRVDAKM